MRVQYTGLRPTRAPLSPLGWDGLVIISRLSDYERQVVIHKSREGSTRTQIT